MTTTNLYAPPGAIVADIAGVDVVAEQRPRRTSRRDHPRRHHLQRDGVLAADGDRRVGMNDGPNPVLIAGGLITLAGLIAWCWLTIKSHRAQWPVHRQELLHIKVVRRDGSRASVSRIFSLRNVVDTLIGMVPLLGILYTIVDALFIFGESRQCLHDKIADTMVVKD